MAGLERPLWLARRRRVRKRLQVRQPRDARQKAVSQSAPWGALVLRVVPLHVSLALLQAQTDESELPQARSLRARLASPLVPRSRVHEPAPYAALEQPPWVFPARPASPPAQRELLARSVLRRLASRSLVEVRRAQQVSSARLSQPRPSPLFPLWQPLRRVLLLPRLLGSFCAPSPRRPQESSSSASSFP
jgi:hypothetical protein